MLWPQDPSATAHCWHESVVNVSLILHLAELLRNRPKLTKKPIWANIGQTTCPKCILLFQNILGKKTRENSKRWRIPAIYSIWGWIFRHFYRPQNVPTKCRIPWHYYMFSVNIARNRSGRWNQSCCDIRVWIYCALVFVCPKMPLNELYGQALAK